MHHVDALMEASPQLANNISFLTYSWNIPLKNVHETNSDEFINKNLF